MASRKILYDTGLKKVYTGDSEDQLIVGFSDNLMGIDGKPNGKVKGKASGNNAISTQIFEYLSSYKVPKFMDDHQN